MANCLVQSVAQYSCDQLSYVLQINYIGQVIAIAQKIKLQMDGGPPLSFLLRLRFVSILRNHQFPCVSQHRQGHQRSWHFRFVVCQLSSWCCTNIHRFGDLLRMCARPPHTHTHKHTRTNRHTVTHIANSHTDQTRDVTVGHNFIRWAIGQIQHFLRLDEIFKLLLVVIRTFFDRNILCAYLNSTLFV